MEHHFWHRRWAKNEIGFHESEGSELLKTHFNAMKLKQGARVFVPLCGKTRDIAWLLNKGLKVLANELNEDAIIALFAELGVPPERSESDGFIIYKAPSLKVFVGDFFALHSQLIKPVDAIYDRAALVALPAELRSQYVAHLRALTNSCMQLLVSYDYDQNLFAGPPFSVSKDEINDHYKAHYDIDSLFRDRIKGGFRGETEVYESVYLLSKRR